MTVRQQTNLVKRGSVFYFRKKVPQDLRDYYGCESIRKSLRGFTSLADAKREAGRLAEYYEAEFEQIRRGRTACTVQLTSELVPALVASFEVASLTADDAIRDRGMDEQLFKGMRADAADQLAATRSAFARGDVSTVRELMLGWLAVSGIEPGQDVEVQRQLARGLLDARLRVLRGIVDFHQELIHMAR
jgi:hypothetical protein